MSGPFLCEVCEVGFAWKSKYDRHVASEKHQQQIQILNMMEVTHPASNDHETDTLEEALSSQGVIGY